MKNLKRMSCFVLIALVAGQAMAMEEHHKTIVVKKDDAQEALRNKMYLSCDLLDL